MTLLAASRDWGSSSIYGCPRQFARRLVGSFCQTPRHNRLETSPSRDHLGKRKEVGGRWWEGGSADNRPARRGEALPAIVKGTTGLSP